MTEKNNILIAKFMGYEYVDPKDSLDSWGWWKKGTYNGDARFNKNFICIHNFGLKYDTDWNWLMPVIEKISSLKFEDGDTCCPRTFGMISEEGEFMFRFNRHVLYKDKELISAAYSAVVDILNNSVAVVLFAPKNDL